MALVKQNVELPIDGGIDTKTDDKQTPFGFLRKAENVVFETNKKLKKRNGYELLPSALFNGGSLTDTLKVDSYEKELLALTRSKMYAYSESLEKWVERGNLYPIAAENFPIIKNVRSQDKFSSIVTDNFLVTSWVDSDGGVRYSVQDLVNKNFIAGDVQVSATAESTTVCAINNIVFIFYSEATNLYYRKLNITDNVLGSPVLVASNVNTTTPIITSTDSGPRCFVAYNSTFGGANVSFFWIDGSENLSSIINLTETNVRALTVYGDTLGRVFIGYTTTTKVGYTVYSNNLNVVLRANTTIEAIANSTNLAFVQDESDVVYCYYEIDQDGTSNNYIKCTTTPVSGSLGTPVVFKRSVGLAAQPVLYNSIVYIPTVFDSATQPTYFLFDDEGALATKYFNQNAAGLIDYGKLNQIFVQDTRLVIPCRVTNKISIDNGVFFTTAGLSYSELEFNPEFFYSSALLARNLHICSGVLKMYDGAKLVEHGFNVFPENIKQINPIIPTITITELGKAAVSEVQIIKFSSVPTQGTYTLTLGAETTSPLAFNASNTAIKSALEALTAVTTVTVTGSYSAGITVTFDAPKQPFDLLQVTNSTLVNEQVTITATENVQGIAPVKEIAELQYSLVPDAGNFTINVGGQITAAIAFNASNATIKATLEALSNITTVTVTGSFTAGHVITIDAPIQPFATFVIASNTLTSGGSAVTVFPSVQQEGIAGVSESQTLTFSLLPQAGNYTIQVGPNTTGLLAFNANNAAIKAAIDALASVVSCTVTGSYAAGITIVIDDPQQPFALFTTPTNTLINNAGAAVTATVTSVTKGVAEIKEVQTITFEAVPVAGTFKLGVGLETSTELNFSSTAADIQAALDALTAIVSCTVTGNFSTGFTITFDNPVTGISQIFFLNNTLSTVPIVEGELTDGNRGYRAVYRWSDNAGRDHRSAPSELLNVVLDAGTETQVTYIRVPTLRLTEKTDVVIELYRTEDAGETFYLAQTLSNDSSVDFVTFIDTLSDADLISKELLYTTGGVLENVAFPPARLVTALPNRLVVVGDDPYRVFFSKIVEEGKPVEFNDIIYRDVLEKFGSISAIQAMDEKTIIFTNDAHFYVTGDGPNNLGQQDTFTIPEVSSTDLGCIDPGSVVYAPVGVMFKSRKGIWLLSKGLAVQYVGDRVEAFNSQTITSAQIVGELNQVRFITNESRALVFNYNLNKWATFENHGGLSSTVIENDYYYVRENSAIYKEDRESFSDASSTIKLKFETGWLSLAEMQGFQRIYYALLLASFKTPHKLKVRVAYDFVDAWVQEEIINPEDFLSNERYGESTTYGSDSPYGGNGNLYQIRVFMKRQKCQAIKISIEDLQDETGEGLSISSVTLRVANKGTENKVPAARGFGVKG